MALDLLIRNEVPWLAAFQVMVAISFVSFALATPLLGTVFEPGGATVGRMLRVMGRFRSMNIEYLGAFLFEHVYTHVARIADFVARDDRDADKAA